MEWMIRQAVASDLETLVQLRFRQLAAEGDEATCDLTEPLYAYYREVLTTAEQTLLVAECNGQIVANGGLSYARKAPRYNNPTGMIGVVFAMYTEPDFRRMGIASDILKKLIDRAKKRGCGEIYVMASDAGVPFYEQAGFCKHDNFRRLMLNEA